MTTRKKTLITAIVVIGVAALLLIQHQTRTKLREENEALRQQVDELSNRVAQAESSEASSVKPSLSAGLAAPRIEVTAPTAGSSSQTFRKEKLERTRQISSDRFW